MPTAYTYRVTVKVNGEEVTVNTFAYNAIDAVAQVSMSMYERGEVKLVSVGPSPENCAAPDVTRMMDRILGKDKQ